MYVKAEVQGESVLPMSSCSSWNDGFVNDMREAQVRFLPQSLALTIQLGVGNGETYVYACADSDVAKKLVEALAVGGSTGQESCDGYAWAVHRCSHGSAMCVADGCESDPCSESRRTDSVLAPCAALSLDVTSRERTAQDDSAIFILMTTFVDRVAPIGVGGIALIVESVSASASALVMLTSNVAGGLVYCRAYENGIEPSSVDEVQFANQVAAFDGSAVSVVVPLSQPLVPGTNYALYCTSSSTEGSVLTLPAVLAARADVMTPCCKAVTVQMTQTSLLAADYEQQAMLVISLEAAPSDSLVVEISSEAVDGDVSGSHTHFGPERILFRRGDTRLERSLVFKGNGAAVPGDYRLKVELSGGSTDEFGLRGAGVGAWYEVLPVSAPLPPPAAMTARFTNNGSLILVSFDTLTDHAGSTTAGARTCSTLFVGEHMSSSCSFVWTTADTLTVVDDSMVPGSRIHLRPDVALKAACDRKECDTSAWVAAMPLHATVLAPAHAVVPVVDVGVPSLVSACSDALVDTSMSRGSGGREWLSEAVHVTTTDTDANRVHALTVSVRAAAGSATFTLPKALLSPGHAYTVTSTKCNFLQACGVTAQTISVLRATYGEVPTVSILGGSIKSMFANDELSLSSEAFVETCSGSRVLEGLIFSWSIVDKRTHAALLDVANGARNPSKLVISAFALTPGRTYAAKLQVTVKETGATASATTTVMVLQADIEASLLVVTGGESAGRTTALRPGEAVLLDASLSLDPNTGSGAELHYSWTCEQVLPTYDDRCPALDLGRYSRWQDLQRLSSALVLFDAPQTSNRVTVIVSSNDGQRSSTSSVVVDTLAVEDPAIRSLDWVTSASAGKKKLTAFSELVLSASIGYGTDMSMHWSVSPEVPNLEALAQTALVSTKLAPSTGSFVEQVVYFKMPGRVLSPRTDYIFTLSMLYATGQSASATVQLSTNGQPLPGSFRVLPSNGVEFVTAFQLEARHWQDDDLPLLYSFGVVQGGTGTDGGTNRDVTLLQVYSEASTGSHMLMAGTVVLQCEIVDSLDASTVVTSEVVVTQDRYNDDNDNDGSGNSGVNGGVSDSGAVPSNVRVVRAFVGRVLSNTSVDAIARSPMLAAQVRASLGSAISAINVVNCSLVSLSMCDGLHRSECRSVPNTCGGCLEDYVGQAGAANSLCVVGAAVGAGAGGQSEVMQLLTLLPRQCPGHCENRGLCVHRPMQLGGTVAAVFDSEFICLVSDVTCEAVCHCDEGWTGDSCEYSSDELRVRQDMKTIVVDSYIAVVESFTDGNVALDTEAAVSGLQSLAARPQELDQGSRAKLTTVLANLAATLSDEEFAGAAATKDVRPTVSTDLLAVADSLLVGRTETLAGGRTPRASAEQRNVELVGTVQGLMNLHVSNMVPGEEMSSVITERMSIVRASVAESDAVDGVLGFEVPSMPFDESPMRVSVMDTRSWRRRLGTAAAEADGLEVREDVAFPQMLRVAGKFVDPQRVYAGNSTVAELGFASSTLLSDALLFDMTGPSSMDIVCGAGGAGDTTGADNYTSLIPTLVHFQLPFMRAPEAEDTPLATLNGTSSVVQCVSGRSSQNVVVCNGADHIISCDGVEVADKTLSCMLSVSQQVVCQSHIFQQAGAEEGADCRVVGRSLTSITCGCDMCAIRRRLEASSSSSSSISNVQIAAMGEFVVSDFVEVNSAFSTAGDASTYTEARLVVGTIFFCVLVFLLGVGVSEWHIADVKKKEEAADAKKHDGDGGYLKGLRAKSVMGLIIPKDNDDEGGRDDEDSDDGDLLWRYVESLFPSVFSSRSALGRLIDELMANHILLMAFYADTRDERLLSAYEFVSVLIQGFFAIAMVVSLDMGSQTGVDGSCDAYVTEARCVDNPSLYDPSESACVWTAGSQTCQSNTDATGNFLTTVYIVLLTIVLAIPLRILHGIVFDGVLKAHNMEPDTAVESRTRQVEISANATPLAQDQCQIATHETGTSLRTSFMRSSFAHTVQTSISLKRTIAIPKKVRDLRCQVFSLDGTSTHGHRQHSMSSKADVPIFKRDDLIFARLHQDMHRYIKNCRLRSVSYSTDRSVCVGRVREATKLSANRGFCRAWRMEVIDNATGLPCTSLRADADESVAVAWKDRERMDTVLCNLEARGYDACNDCWGYDSAAAGAEVCRHLLLDLLGRHTARGKIFEAKSNWYVHDGLVVTPHFKAAVFVASMLLNVYYVWIIIMYGSTKGEQWQRTWMALCACYMFFMIVFEMTVEATMVGFVIPCQALGDVRSLQADLSMKLTSTCVQQAFLDHAAKYEDGQRGADVESQTVGERRDVVAKDPSAFNATNFLFVSSRLAQAFPSLPEAVLVEVFASVHPRYGLVTREREPELNNVTAALRHSALRHGAPKPMFMRMCLSASSFSLSGLLMWIGTQPVLFQKLLINLPMPLMSSLVACVVYLTATMSLMFATGVLVFGGLVLGGGTVWVISTARRTVRDSELEDLKHRADMTRMHSEQRRRRTNDAALVPKTGVMLKVMSQMTSSRTLGDVVPDFDVVGGGGGSEAPMRRQSVVNPQFQAWDDGSDHMQVQDRLGEGTPLAAVMPASEADAHEAELLREHMERSAAGHRRSMMVHEEKRRRRLKEGMAAVDAEPDPLKCGRGAGTILRTGREAEDAIDLDMARKPLHCTKLLQRLTRNQDFQTSSSGSEASASGSDPDQDVFDDDDACSNVVNVQGAVSAPPAPEVRSGATAVVASRWATLRERRASVIRLAFEHSSSDENDACDAFDPYASSLDSGTVSDAYSDVRLPEVTVVTRVIKKKGRLDDTKANVAVTTDGVGDAITKRFATKNIVRKAKKKAKAKAKATGTGDGKQQQAAVDAASSTVEDVTDQVVSLIAEQEHDAAHDGVDVARAVLAARTSFAQLGGSARSTLSRHVSILLEQDMSSDTDVDVDVGNSSSCSSGGD